MFKKLEPIMVKPDQPFENDALGRNEPIDILTKLVTNLTQPFVLSIEAPWGFGKTTFCHLWKAHLESQKHVCFYFNAWENDFVDDPLIAFIGEMAAFIEGTSGLEQNHNIKKHWGSVKKIGAGVLRKTLPLAIQIATHSLLNSENVTNAFEELTENSDEISKFASEFAKDRLEKYAAEKTGIKAFRQNLEKFALEITNKNQKKPQIIFFVDELDRCRPDFAIALLERIKHLFNVPNVIFVLSIDRSQLNQSVKATYGLETSPDGYLRRFIDLSYKLPEPDGPHFAYNLFKKFSFSDFNWHSGIELFAQSFSEFARVFNMSLRAQEQCFMEIAIVLRTNVKLRDFPVALAFLATLRMARPDIMEDLRSNKVDIERALELVSQINNDEFKLHAEAALRVEFLSEANTSKITSIKNALASAGRQRSLQLIHWMEEYNQWSPNVTNCILSSLALTRRFN